MPTIREYHPVRIVVAGTPRDAAWEARRISLVIPHPDGERHISISGKGIAKILRIDDGLGFRGTVILALALALGVETEEE